MRRRDFLERRELGLCAREVLGAKQRRHEAIVRGDLVAVLALGDRGIEPLTASFASPS